jgi:hypothetical protein
MFADQANLVSPVSMSFSNVYDQNSRRAVFNIVKNTPSTIMILPKATPGTGQESVAIVQQMVGWGNASINLNGPASTPVSITLPNPMQFRASKNEYFFLCSNELSQGGAYVNNRLTNLIACIPAGKTKTLDYISYDNSNASFLTVGKERRADNIDVYLADTDGTRLADINFAVTFEFE